VDQIGQYAEGTQLTPWYVTGETTEQKPMPLYEYLCSKCGKKFSEVLTIKEHETKKVRCPKCQSSELQKIIEPFFAKTARKS
jgi:putative FmdB family regulatory protein